jgi:hypothetical protein
MSSSFNYIDFKSNIDYHDPTQPFLNNSSFKLPIWKHDEEVNTSFEILIMINGFLEGVERDAVRRERVMNMRYGPIAQKLLRDKNIVSVLMPLPFHFNRSLDIDGENDYAPITRLTESGTYLYYGGYTQIVTDVKKLVNDIEKDPSKFGLKKDSPIKFHLLWYSIGGVAAIGTALNFNADNKPKFESLSVLLSAWNLAMVEPSAVVDAIGRRYGLTTELWNRMIKELNYIKESVNPIFRKLIWDKGDQIDFTKCANRVFFLNGFRDEIFTTSHTESVRQQVLEMMDKCTFINLPTDHLALRSTEEIAGYVSNFICNGR